MKTVARLSKILDFIINILFVICCFYTAFIAVACILQVFTRYVLNSSFTWTEEAARFSWISLGMLGCPVALRKNTHVKIDILSNKLSNRAYQIHQIIIYVLVGIACVFFCSSGYALFQGLINSKGVTMTFFPMYLVYWTIPTGGFFSVLCCIVKILELVFLGPEQKKKKGVGEVAKP